MGGFKRNRKKFLKQAADYGNFVAVCYSQEIALKVIEDYVTTKTGEIMPIENNQVLKRWEGKEMAKVIKMVAAFDYPNTMEKVLPIEEIVERITEKGYKVEIGKIDMMLMQTEGKRIKVYEETEL